MTNADSAILTPRGRAAWKAIEPLLRRRGVFWDGRAGGHFELFLLAEAYGAYRMTLDMAARVSGRARRHLLREADAERRQARAFAAKFFDLIPAARVGLAPVDADGEDLELAGWFRAAPDNDPKGHHHRSGVVEQRRHCIDTNDEEET